MNVNLDAIADHDVRNTVANYAASINADGTITGRPGKFELEPIWTVYFYELTMSGDGETFYVSTDPDGEDDAYCYDKFTINAEDVEAFPWLEQYHGQDIVVWTDSQGFTMARILTVETHEQWAARYYGITPEAD